jgi:hypothetical protein
LTGGAKTDHEALLGGLLAWVDAHLGLDTLMAVGHRVVHGGRDFTGPVRLNDTVLTTLDALTPLAPASAAQPVAGAGDHVAASRAVVGCLLRHRVSPHPAGPTNISRACCARRRRVLRQAG